MTALHPATRLPLAGSGKCGSCEHLFAEAVPPGYQLRCTQSLNNGEGPNLRKSWPACSAFKSVEG